MYSSRIRKFEIAGIALRCSLLFMLCSALGRTGIRVKMIQSEFHTVVGLCLSSSSSQIDMNIRSSSSTVTFNGNLPIATTKIVNGKNDVSGIARAAPKSAGSEKNGIKGLCDFDCNLLHKDVINDKDRLISAANGLGIKYFVIPGSNLESSRDILGLAESQNEVRLIGSAGVHPYNAVTDVYSEADVLELTKLVAQENCFAVGECGLDFSKGFPEKEQQIKWFRSHITLAIEHSKPLYLHSRDAEDDFMSVLNEFGFDISSEPQVPCCVHCFTGTTEELQRYLAHGFYIGLTGYIFTLDDEKLLLWLNMISLNRLVIETDAPYMGFKGCRSAEEKDRKRTYPNPPTSLVKVLDRICKVSGWDPSEVTLRTSSNALNGFLRMGV